MYAKQGDTVQFVLESDTRDSKALRWHFGICNIDRDNSSRTMSVNFMTIKLFEERDSERFNVVIATDNTKREPCLYYFLEYKNRPEQINRED